MFVEFITEDGYKVSLNPKYVISFWERYKNPEKITIQYQYGEKGDAITVEDSYSSVKEKLEGLDKPFEPSDKFKGAIQCL